MESTSELSVESRLVDAVSASYDSFEKRCSETVCVSDDECSVDASEETVEYDVA